MEDNEHMYTRLFLGILRSLLHYLVVGYRLLADNDDAAERRRNRNEETGFTFDVLLSPARWHEVFLGKVHFACLQMAAIVVLVDVGERWHHCAFEVTVEREENVTYAYDPGT